LRTTRNTSARQERFLLRKILAVPEEVAHVPELDTALYVTLRFLLQSPSLSFISVWAPSFLTILLEHLHNNAERFAGRSA